MTWNTTPPTVRGRLARHLGRLQQNLDAVGEQVREAVANAVGRTVAEAVGDAVYQALCPRADAAHSWPQASYGAHTRRGWNEPAWERDAARSNWRDAYDYDEYDDPPYGDDREPLESVSRPEESRGGRWSRAVATGVQAAAWWLRRHPGRVSLLAALTVGAVAGLAVLAGHASGVAGVVMSSLGLAYLLDLLRSASSLFGRDSRP